MIGGFILLDLVLDRYLGGLHRFDWPHLVLAASVLLVSYILMRRAEDARRRVEAVLRQARDDMESLVRERTAELEQANEALRREVAERERVEHALRTSEETARALLDASTESAVLLDIRGNVLAANQTAAERLGAADDLTGRSLFDFFTPEVTARRRTHLDTILQTGHPVHFIDERDGRTYDNHVYPICDADGRIVRLAAFGQDITERLQAELALRSTQLQLEAEKRHLEAVLQALPVGVVITDAQGGILLTNGMDEQIWGSRPITHEVDDYVQYQAWWVDSGKPVEPHEWASAQAVLKGESVFGQMLEIQRFDGGRGVVLNSAVPIRDNEGRIVGSAVAIQDITALRRAEEALRASEEKYRLLFQNMAEGFALYELLYDEQNQPADWRILEVNDAYSRHTGIARDRVVSRRISELFPEAIPEYLPRFAQVVASQGASRFETYAKAVGRYQRVSVFPAGGHRFASIIEDITDRKHAEEELCASEERFATVFRFSPDGIGIFSVGNGAFLDVNEAFAKMLGCSRSEIVGHTWKSLKLVTAPDAVDEITELFLKQEQLVDHELTITTRQGNLITVLVSLVPITVSGKSCVLAIGHDITKRIRAEESLRQTQAELALRIQERTALRERQRLARELHDSVSQALYGISLGINTALTLFDIDRAKVLEALNYALSLAHGGLAEMRALIFELRPESLEIEGLVVALSKQAEALRSRHGVEVKVSLCEEPDVPIAVKEAVYRIAQEALQNAIKHAHPSQLDVRLICRPESLMLEVCDNGAGFDPLASYPGHLGLRSMRERAIDVGGNLDIDSTPDCGTQIRVRIPLAAPEIA